MEFCKRIEYLEEEIDNLKKQGGDMTLVLKEGKFIG